MYSLCPAKRRLIQSVSYSEFAPFANSLKKVDEHYIATAFPETFGVSTRIERVDRNTGSLGQGNPGMPRTYPVSKNLSLLPAYYDWLSMN